ncbi:MAG: protein kinase, partial [Elusimicrobiota bacterium]
FECPAGKDAKEMLSESKRLPLAQAMGIIRPVCAGLAASHQSGLAHRNVRPSSFLILEGGTVLLRDFALSFELEQAGGKSGGAGSAPVLDPAGLALKAYDAPEGRGGPQADVWGLGVSLYELISGMIPFPAASTQAKTTRAFAKVGSLVPGLPPSIDLLIHRALDPDPRARVSLKELTAIIEGACGEMTPSRR